MARKKRKRRRRQGNPPHRRKDGIMTSMRGGFKSVARSVGVGGPPKKRSWLSSVVTLALIAVAAAIFYYRF